MLILIHTDMDVSQLAKAAQELFQKDIEKDIRIGQESIMFRWNRESFMRFCRMLSKVLIDHTLNVLVISALNKRRDFDRRTRRYSFARFEAGKKTIPYMWQERSRDSEALPYHYALMMGFDAKQIYDEYELNSETSELDPTRTLLQNMIPHNNDEKWCKNVDIYQYKYLIGVETPTEIFGLMKIIYENTEIDCIKHANCFGLHQIIVSGGNGMFEATFK